MIINSKTKLFCVFGTPITHSLSPNIHNNWFKTYKINASYMAFDISNKNLKSAVQAIKALNIAGVNVTVPHKVNIMKYVDNIDINAKKIGSINTIVNKSNKLYAYNSDYEGFLKDLTEKHINLKNKNILVIGAGGASKAIVYALTKLKTKNIFLTSRTLSNAKAISKKYKNIKTLDISTIPSNFLENIDCLINCSTCGMNIKDVFPFSIKEFNKNIIFYDIIYNKLTPFKKFAIKNKIKYFSGEGLLINQAAVSFNKWLNIYPNTKQAYTLVKKLLEHSC